MCVPCKIILNQDTQNTAQLANTLRQQIVEHCLDESRDSLLRTLAGYEMAFKNGVRTVAMAFAKDVTDDPNWHKLMGDL